jgi:hypothetical protein
MKNTLFVLLALVTFTGAVHAYGVDAPKASSTMAVVKSGSTFKLFYKGVKRGSVKVTIYNEIGESVYSETLRHVSNFVRPYNLSSLKKGTYSIEIIDDNGKRTENLDYTDVSAKGNKIIFLKALPGAPHKYILSMNNKKSDVLSIDIFNKNNDLLYSSTEKTSGDFSKIYNLDKSETNVVFQVTDKQGNTTILK